jgi:hypothetical protein
MLRPLLGATRPPRTQPPPNGPGRWRLPRRSFVAHYPLRPTTAPLSGVSGQRGTWCALGSIPTVPWSMARRPRSPGSGGPSLPTTMTASSLPLRSERRHRGSTRSAAPRRGRFSWLLERLSLVRPSARTAWGARTRSPPAGAGPPRPHGRRPAFGRCCLSGLTGPRTTLTCCGCPRTRRKGTSASPNSATAPNLPPSTSTGMPPPTRSPSVARRSSASPSTSGRPSPAPSTRLRSSRGSWPG